MLKRNFVKGRMNLDVDERLLPEGEYRRAENIYIINSEGSDAGAVENSLSNKQLTYLDLGNNPRELGKYEDEKNNKLFWLVKSDEACFLLEWDENNQVQSVVLKDSRPEDNGRVFALDDDFLITGIDRVISDDGENDLLLIADNNIEPLCINIERAKTWGENNFEREDIYLIKKPPRYAPSTTPLLVDNGSNYIEDKFFLFTYRYKYLDGEYSALSSYSLYNFFPKEYDLNFYTLENRGMINAYNAINIQFNTGEKQVTDIQIVAKESNSNALYIVETFNKSDEGWGDNLDQNFIFYNNKIYTLLPETELYRPFDNVPRKAKALTIAENFPVFGNYLEGYNIENEDGTPIKIDYTVDFNSYEVESGEILPYTLHPLNIEIDLEPISSGVLNEGNRLFLYFNIKMEDATVYSNSFFLPIEEDYAILTELFLSDEFINLINIINSNIASTFNTEGTYDVPDGWEVLQPPSISISTLGGEGTFTVEEAVYIDTFNEDNEETVATTFENTSEFSIQSFDNNTSCKSNRVYEVGLVYKDHFGRMTTVLTSERNSLYIPQLNAKDFNKILVTVNNIAPYWATHYKFVVKTPPLQYQNVYVTKFFNDDEYTWCLLEGDNKDKVQEGDILIPKIAPDFVQSVIKIKVLEVKVQQENFISENYDEEENEIIEPAGVYMKIRPEGFSMSYSDYRILESEAPYERSGGYPITHLDLFSIVDPDDPTSVIGEESVPEGSSVILWIKSNREFDDGWRDSEFEKEFFAQQDYETVEEFFEEMIIGQQLISESTFDGEPDGTYDYQDQISLARGNTISGIDPADDEKLFLIIIGLHSGGSRNRKGGVKARLTIRQSSGTYVFETNPKQAEQEIFYESPETFEIINGYHQGNQQNQDASKDSISELSFFNCFIFNEGIESYRVKDAFNSNYLNIDSRPSSTSIEEYKEVRRFADWTYGEAYVESSGINGLNVFNISTNNWKQGDKQYGEIQKLFTRDTDIISLQEYKAFRVLFGKDLISTAEGEPVISSIPEILGKYIPFSGDNGIGKHPESFAVDAYRIYYVCPQNGTPIRLSRDGTEEINYGTSSFFRDLFIESNGSKKIGGYDPHKELYFLFSEEPLIPEYRASCGNNIVRRIEETFQYTLDINNLFGDIILAYQLIEGIADIEVEYDNDTYQENNASGIGTIVIPRENLSATEVLITLTPVSESAIISIDNICPVGTPMKITTIVLNDESHLNKTVTNRFGWGPTQLYSENHFFDDFEISKFVTETGIEGVGKFPARDENVSIQSYKTPLDTVRFNEEIGNKLGYLVTTNNYTESDIDDILDDADFVDTSETQLTANSYINQGSFTFNRPSDNHNLYLIWDYRQLQISINTHIMIYFDSSGSMNSSLAPLQDMRDTLLKNALLPFYDFDEDAYDEQVTIISESNERTFEMLNMQGDTPEGNVVVLVFQDESTTYNADSGTFDPLDPPSSSYESDIAILRGRLNSFDASYMRGVIFQVQGFRPFHDLIEAVENGYGNYSSNNGLSDRSEINFKYEINDGDTPQYYLDLIINALQELGYNI